MKRYFLVIIVIVYCCAAKAQIIDTISFSTDNVSLFSENGYTRIDMNLCETTEEIGYPELPRLELSYILPYHSKISSIMIIDSTKVLLSSNVVVYPKQPEYSMDDTIQHEFVNPYREVYESNALYPNKIVEVSQQYYEKGFHIATVNIYPVCYTPSDNKIELYTNIRFQLNYEDYNSIVTRPKTQSRYMYNLTENLVYHRIRNKNDFALCDKGPLHIPLDLNVPVHHYMSLLDMGDEVDPEYIIITNNYDVNGNLIEDASFPGLLMTDVFLELANWKTQRGIPTKIITIDDISSNYCGNDTQEKIHNFLADVYDNYGSLYVLFGGDVNIVPERMVYGYYTGRSYLLPSDLYYVAVGSTWNTNCNSMYGEAEDIDSQYEIPQFYYGRASVENLSEAIVFVNKSCDYEILANILPSQRDYINNIVAMSRNSINYYYPREIEKGLGRTITKYDGNGNSIGQYNYGIVQNCIENWKLYEESFKYINDDISNYLVGNSWNWQNHNMVFSKEPALSCFSSKIPLSSEENPKYAHFIFHVDHSSYLNMGTSSEIMHQSIDKSDVDGFLNAPFYQIIYTGGCEPGEYHKDCITERFINNPNGGAVAMFASSSTSNSDYIGFVGMLKDMYYCVDNNVQLSPHLYNLGTLHDNNLSKGGGNTSTDISFKKRKHHLFGDPTIAVWTREPVDLTVSTTPSAITNQSSQLTVSVSGMAYSEYATNDVDVCVMKDGEVYLREHYNGTAHNHDFVFEDVHPETAGNLKVTVTGHNYIPYETTIPVTITGKNVYISERSVEDDAGNNDGNLDAGETVNLSIALKNNGTVNLTNVTALLSCEFLDNTLNQNINDYLTVVTSIAIYGTIAQNATVTKNDFQLTLSNAIPDRTTLRCTLTISDGNGSVSERSFSLPIGAPVIEYVSVRHEVKQNGRIGLDIELNNLGFGSAKGIAATLSSSSTGVQITQGTATYGNMAHLEAKMGSFEFIPTDNNIEGKSFTLNVTDAYGKSWTSEFDLYDIVDIVENLSFTSTEHSIKLKWDPVENSRGYYVYRSSTANGDYERLNNYPIPSAVYPDMGLEAMQTYYYGVSYLDQNGNESTQARITAWTSLPVAEGWPVSIPDGLGRAWGTAPNVADVNGDGQQEIFLSTGTGDQFENLGAILGFNNQGEELFDIDHNPTTISGFANLHVSMTCTPAIGDIDNDGVMEIVVATRGDENESNYNLYVYKNVDTDNDGAPDLAWESKPLDFKNFNGVVLADLDDNGTLEIIAPNQGRGGSDGITYTYLEVFDCLGEYYYPKSTIKVLDYCNHDGKAVTMPIVADFGNDGNKEIVFGLEGGIYLWNCSNQVLSGLFLSNPSLNNPDNRERTDCPVIAADIDGDGELEILYMVIRDLTGYVRAIESNRNPVSSAWSGDNHYISLSSTEHKWEWPPYFCVADIDNDGSIEVFAADGDILKMWNADGTTLGEIQIPNLDCRYFQPVIADIDGNGDCEIIIPSQNGYIYAYKSNGDAVPGWPLAVVDLATIPVVTDIDGDGFNEVIAASQTELYVWHTEGESKYNQWDRFRFNKFNNAVYETPCSFDAVPLEITGTQVWNDDRRINRNIFVNNGAQLTIKSEVRFPEDSKIIVEQGGRLILDGCKLTNSCPDEFWQGIEVWGNSSMHQATINGVCGQGFLELKNGAVIENAKCAVELWRPGDYTTTGGIIHATDAIFRNNATAVRALSYNNYHPYTHAPKNYNAYFNNCSFVVDENYIGSETFEKHIVLLLVDGIEFKGCDFSATRSVNGVDPYCLGLSTYDASFSVTSPCTTNNTPCPWEEMDHSTFTGLYSGIRASGGLNNPRTFVVREAIFSNNDYGINVLNSNFPIIIFNDFEIGGGYCDFNYGVCLNNSTSFSVEENHFHPIPNTTNSTVGVAVCNSNSINNVYRNTFDGLSVANLALGQNTEISNGMSAGRLQGLTYTCNEFDGNGYDIMALKEEGVGNIQFQQGTSALPAGNIFENSTFQIYNDGVNQIAYYYNPNGLDETPNTSMLYRVTPQSANGSNNCISHYGNNPVVKSPSEKAELAMEYLAAYNAYLDLRRLYESHMDDSDTADPTADNSPAAEMLQVGAQMAQYSHEYTLAAGDIVRSNLNDSVANPTELRTWLGNMNDIAADRMIVSSYIQEGDSANAFTLANMLPAKHDMKGDQLTDHGCYMRLINLHQALHRSRRNIFQLTETEANLVRDIAENGLGVSQSMAEAILEQITDRSRDACFSPELPNGGDGDKGIMTHSNITEKEEKVLNVSVAPNPATTWTTVNYSLPKQGTRALLTLTNVLGVNVLSMELEGAQGSKVLDLRGLAAGVYVYTIRYEQFTEIGKLVIR